MIADETISFRPYVAGDETRMREWLTLPHVARWFPDVDRQLAELRGQHGAAWISHYIVERDGRDIGFIQCYSTADQDDDTFADQPVGTVGLDCLIGEADLVGRGIGTGMMKAFLGRVFATTDAPRAIIDPDPANVAAVRCYEKAGFRPIELRDTPFGQTLLMAQDRPEAQDRPNKKESVAA